MKRHFYPLLVLLSLASCEITNLREGMFAEPVPCHVESILTNIRRISINEEYGTPEVSNITESVEAEYFNISVLTFDSLIGWNGEDLGFRTGIGQGIIASEGTYCEESIPEVEQHIHNWVKEQNENSEPLWDVSWNTHTRTNCYHFPYRLEGVTALMITANQPFNGIEAGKDITKCFAIGQSSPSLIFSYDDYSVYTSVWGKKTSISEWLALRPLASPCILLCLTDEAMEAASNIAFTITMTLTNGKVLTDTTPTANLLK